MKNEEAILRVLEDISSLLKAKFKDLVKENTRFIKNTDGSVIDKSMGLMWGPTLSGEMKYADADKACKDFNLGGYRDWRLPKVKELISLVDYEKREPAIDKEFFPDTKSSYYWTSTPYVGYSGYR